MNQNQNHKPQPQQRQRLMNRNHLCDIKIAYQNLYNVKTKIAKHKIITKNKDPFGVFIVWNGIRNERI